MEETMSKARICYTAEFKKAILKELEKGRSVRAVAAAYGITITTLYGWYHKAQRGTAQR